MGLRSRGSLVGEIHSGREVSFSRAAYADAMQRYKLKDIEDVVIQIERREGVGSGVGSFFRDFAIVQEVDHPDFDRGTGIGSLATRIELARGEVTIQELRQKGIDVAADIVEYNLAFGTDVQI